MVAVLALVLGASGCDTTQKPPGASAAVQVELQERAWLKAFKDRNHAMLNAVLAEEFVFTDDEGNVFDKKQYVTSVDAMQVESYSVDGIKIQLFGDTAVLIARWSGKIIIDGKEADVVDRFTDTFVRREGRWQAVASQDTRVPKANEQ